MADKIVNKKFENMDKKKYGKTFGVPSRIFSIALIFV